MTNVPKCSYTRTVLAHNYQNFKNYWEKQKKIIENRPDFVFFYVPNSKSNITIVYRDLNFKLTFSRHDRILFCLF